MIKAIFFDIGGTIHNQIRTIDSDELFKNNLKNFMSKHNIFINNENIVELIDNGIKKYKSFVEKKMIELPSKDIWTKFVFSDNSIVLSKINGLEENLSFLYDRYRKQIIPKNDLHDTLRILKDKGYRLGIISNIMSREFVPSILKEYGVDSYFETLVLSSVSGFRKPSPDIFYQAINQMGVKKEETAYIGDTISRDVLGAKNAELALMIQIDNPSIYYKDKTYVKSGIYPDVKIKNLLQIVDIVEEYNKKKVRSNGF